MHYLSDMNLFIQLSKGHQKLSIILENKELRKSRQKMSITNNLLQKWYSSMKKIRKCLTVFEIENWLWKSESCNFYSTKCKTYFFIGVLFGFEHKGWSCKMCESVRQNCGHTNYRHSYAHFVRFFGVKLPNGLSIRIRSRYTHSLGWPNKGKSSPTHSGDCCYRDL
jgi:hypothetical protein